MTFDGGWGYILSTCIGVALMWIGGLVTRHFDHSQDAADDAGKAVEELEKRFLEYKAHVAEHYVKVLTVERMETNIFAVMSRIEAKVDDLHKERSSHG
jgi:hypothetical protein